MWVGDSEGLSGVSYDVECVGVGKFFDECFYRVFAWGVFVEVCIALDGFVDVFYGYGAYVGVAHNGALSQYAYVIGVLQQVENGMGIVDATANVHILDLCLQVVAYGVVFA